MIRSGYVHSGAARPSPDGQPASGRRPGRRQEPADDALIRTLYAEHGGALLGYTTRLLSGDRAAAEDVVQETLLRAWRNPQALISGRGSVRGWLLTVARNLVIDRARARAARPIEVTDSPYTQPVEADHGQSVVDTMVVVAALDTLSPEHRAVLIEVYYNGLSVTEAAERLGLPPGTVKSRTYYALRVLRGLLTESESEPSGDRRPVETPGRPASAAALCGRYEPSPRSMDSCRG
jgi:RNA polymerase sigma-70 factor (ECF subfamily)